MARRRSSTPSSSTSTAAAGNGTPKKGVTPPKGRPTRPRNGRWGRKRAFGPVAQWITAAAALVLVLVVLIMVTGGGDFNPFDEDDQAPSQFGAPPAVVASATR